MLQINNRRYIGSKTKLLTKIKDAVNESIQDPGFSFADLFAGTGVVAYEFAKMGHPVTLNDTLYSNVIAYKAWMGSDSIDEDKIKESINVFNSLKYSEIEENYFSNVYGGKYFSINDAKKIGYIRDYIEDHRSIYNEREYCVLLSSLIYATDKIANTVGHFESFLNNCPKDSDFKLQGLDLIKIKDATIFNMDANELAGDVVADVVYLDPPYNARQYVNFYHVLENLARWEKPSEFEGNSMKFKRNHLKSGYSRSCAPSLLKDLVDKLQCKVIVVSYNNTYNAKSGASNNKIQEQEIVDILSRRGTIKKIEIDYKGFNAGKTDFKNHKEYLFVCKIS